MKKLTAALLLALLLTGCAAQTQTPPAAAAEPSPAPEAQTVTQTPAAEAKPSPVYTDWSKLTPYEPTRDICTRHAGWRAGSELSPRGDYGVLLPYIGQYAAMEDYVIQALPLYGLVTDKAELVTDPVYAMIDFRDDFLLLYRGDPTREEIGEEIYGGGSYERTLAAADGRWAHKLGDSYYVTNGYGLLLTAAPDGSLDVWNADGKIVRHFGREQFAPRFGEKFYWGEMGGPFINLADDKVAYAGCYVVNGEYLEDGVRLYLDLAEGTVLDEPPEGYPPEFDYSSLEPDVTVPPAVEAYNYYDPVVDLITGEVYYSVFVSGGDEGSWHYALYDSAGAMLVENVSLEPFEEPVILRAGLCATLEDGCFCFRSLSDHSLVFRRVMQSNSD
ncbi:MAG: hypothetical protein J5449_04945 [Oscillospiraceae bacterium]|nr:hypothetical protein [Oscillospiraceae bacterium]